MQADGHWNKQTSDPMDTLEYLSLAGQWWRLAEILLTALSHLSETKIQKKSENKRQRISTILKMANPLINFLMENDRRVLKKILIFLGIIVFSAAFNIGKSLSEELIFSSVNPKCSIPLLGRFSLIIHQIYISRTLVERH